MEANYNQTLVNELIEKAKGPNRSLRTYATQAGINVATLSRICSGKRIATIKHLQLLTSSNAEPQGGVTLEELATAAGYVNVPSDNSKLYQKEALKKAKELEMKVIGALQYHFLQKDISVEMIKDCSKYYSPDISALINGRVWWFEVVSVSNRFLNCSEFAKSIFTKIITAKPDKDRNLVIVADSYNMFEELATYSNELAYKGNLLAVFFDAENMMFKNECILSTYDEGDKISLIS